MKAKVCFVSHLVSEGWMTTSAVPTLSSRVECQKNNHTKLPIEVNTPNQTPVDPQLKKKTHTHLVRRHPGTPQPPLIDSQPRAPRVLTEHNVLCRPGVNDQTLLKHSAPFYVTAPHLERHHDGGISEAKNAHRSTSCH